MTRSILLMVGQKNFSNKIPFLLRFFNSDEASAVGQQAGQPESQYAGHQEGQQATGKSVGRPSAEKKIHHCPVMQGLCKLQSEEFLLRPA